MPTYEYRCGTCGDEGQTYQVEQSIRAGPFTTCSALRAGIVERIVEDYELADSSEINVERLAKREKIAIPPKDCDGSVQRLVGNGNFVLKGGGWYADGYSNGGNTGNSESND